MTRCVLKVLNILFRGAYGHRSALTAYLSLSPVFSLVSPRSLLRLFHVHNSRSHPPPTDPTDSSVARAYSNLPLSLSPTRQKGKLGLPHTYTYYVEHCIPGLHTATQSLDVQTQTSFSTLQIQRFCVHQLRLSRLHGEIMHALLRCPLRIGPSMKSGPYCRNTWLQKCCNFE